MIYLISSTLNIKINFISLKHQINIVFLIDVFFLVYFSIKNSVSFKKLLGTENS